MDICTKVTLRQRLLKSGKITLYFDYYPPIRNSRTNRLQRHEYLGIYLYSQPRNQVERSFNQRMSEKAEAIRCQRQEAVINRQFGFIDRSQEKEDFLQYFEDFSKTKPQKWQIAYLHFKKFCGKCTFGDLTVDLCMKFRTYLLSANQLKHAKMKLSRNSAAAYFSTFRAMLKQAHKEGRIAENINDHLEFIKWEETEREFLSREELVLLAKTPCKIDVLRRASLFSCLTGLRISDILNLQWQNIREVAGIGLCIVFKTKKTKSPATLPICQEAAELLGEHQEDGDKVFKDLRRSMTGKPLKAWLEAAGIVRHITFHSFRHTFATLQLAAGTNPYAVSLALTHKKLTTTLIYAHGVPKVLLDTVGKISLKPQNSQKE